MEILNLQMNWRNHWHIKCKKKKVILKLQEENTVIRDDANLQKVFHQYYTTLHKGPEISLEKVEE